MDSFDRLAKEYVLYVEEVKQLYAKKEKLIKEGAEEWNIKNAVSQLRFQLSIGWNKVTFVI